MGVLTQHMVVHLTAMGLIAPMIAFATIGIAPAVSTGPVALGMATAVQILLLWAWHVPTVLASAVGQPILLVAMHLSLLVAAVWFWTAIIGRARARSWPAMAALLITGKFFCLLGLLLTLSPRPLYAEAGLVATCFGTVMPSHLADQQLAGLLMLAACPIAYVSAATALTMRLLRYGATRQWIPAAPAR